MKDRYKFRDDREDWEPKHKKTKSKKRNHKRINNPTDVEAIMQSMNEEEQQ